MVCIFIFHCVTVQAENKLLKSLVSNFEAYVTQSTKRIGEGVFWLSLNGKKAEKVEHYSKLVGGGGNGGGG